MQNSVIDLIIRIKNGYLARKEKIKVIKSKLNKEVLEILKSLGFIKSYKDDGIRTINVELLYKNQQPAVTDVQIFSKPGRRLYVSYKNLKLVMGGMGYSILSTSKGVLTNRQAKVKKIGGELLFSIR